MKTRRPCRIDRTVVQADRAVRVSLPGRAWCAREKLWHAGCIALGFLRIGQFWKGGSIDGVEKTSASQLVLVGPDFERLLGVCCAAEEFIALAPKLDLAQQT